MEKFPTINIRSILAFREIGKGHSAIETFCGLKNMPPSMTSKTYEETIENMHPVYSDSARESMKAAANEIRKDSFGDEYTEETVVNVDISADGSWQKRGFSSLNGLIAIISILTGKCLAFEAMTKDCKSCRFWESKKDSPAYQTFIEKHDCPINHTGSAGSMEPAGILKCFLRSVGILKLRFVNLLVMATRKLSWK